MAQADLLRAARAILNWSLIEASRRAGLSAATVLAAEGRGVSSISASAAAVQKLQLTYEGEGLSFFVDAASHGIKLGVPHLQPKVDMP